MKLTVSCWGAQYKTVSPVGDRVLVKVDESEPASAGGILLPTSAQRKPTQGSVHSLGDVKSLKAGCPLCKSAADGAPLTSQVARDHALPAVRRQRCYPARCELRRPLAFKCRRRKWNCVVDQLALRS